MLQAQQAFHMPTHTLERKDSSLPVHPPAVQAQQAQQAFAMPTHAVSRKGSPNMPTVGEDSDGSGGATAKAQALYAAPAEGAPPAQAAEPGAEAGGEDATQDAAPAGSALQPETSSVVLQPEAPAQASAARSNSPRPPLPGVPSGDGPLGCPLGQACRSPRQCSHTAPLGCLPGNSCGLCVLCYHAVCGGMTVCCAHVTSHLLGP